MFGTRSGLVVGAVVVGLAVGCSDEIEDKPRGTGGGTGGAGSGGSGGTGQNDSCQPTDPVCFGNRPPTSAGSECLAARDNNASPTTNIQMRQTWARTTNPPGSAINVVYESLTTRAQLTLPACNMRLGRSGYIQLTDWDRSNPDITKQTSRVGYSTFVPDEAAALKAVSEGLCMTALNYDEPGFRYTTPLKTGQGMNLPWDVKPTLARRVADKAAFDAKKAAGVPIGEGIFYVDETTNRTYGYSPLGWVVIWSSPEIKLALPIHEVQTTSKFNDSTHNCAGSYRPDRLSLNSDCDSVDAMRPAWGCATDSEMGPNGEPCKAGEGPNFSQGYYLITELEQVYSREQQATLCVTMPTAEKSTADGWAVTEPTTNAKWCRGSPNWNPDDQDGPDNVPGNADDGLPMGDWCSKTNKPATPECHDAYLSKTFGTGQAFPVKAATCEK